MTKKPIHLGNIDEQPENRDWLRIMAHRNAEKQQQEPTRRANETPHSEKNTRLNPYTGSSDGAQDFGDPYGTPSREGNHIATPAEFEGIKKEGITSKRVVSTANGEVEKGLEMTYLDPDDLDASWEAIQHLIANNQGGDGDASDES